MNLSNELAVWYASGGTQRLISVMEVRAGSERFFLHPGYETVDVRLETGEVVTVDYGPIDSSLLGIDNAGKQSLKIGFENVTGEVLEFVNWALENQLVITLVYREYLDSDLTEPARKPIRMTAHDASVEGDVVVFVAGHFDIVNTQFNRESYTAEKYPGIRYDG